MHRPFRRNALSLLAWSLGLSLTACAANRVRAEPPAEVKLGGAQSAAPLRDVADAGDAAPDASTSRPRSEVRRRCEDEDMIDACVTWSYRVFPNYGRVTHPEAPEVVAKLAELCRAGKAAACRAAFHGTHLLHESGTSPPGFDVRWLLERSCDLDGDAQDCVTLASKLETEGKAGEGFVLRERACFDHDYGCKEVGDRVEAGRATPGAAHGGDRSQYLADVRARACTFDASECTKYAALYRAGVRARGGFPKMVERVTECERSAKDGVPVGCELAAAAHAFGLAVPRDLKRAQQLYAYRCIDRETKRPVPGRTCPLPPEWR